MAFVDLIIGVGFGADKLTLTEGEGFTQPQVSSAVSTGHNTVEVTFDRTMLFVGPNSVLLPGKYTLAPVLKVLNVTKKSDTVVTLTVMDQADIAYVVAATGVIDGFGKPIDLNNNTAGFAGIAPVFPSAVGVESLFGLDHGVQAVSQADWDPDLIPPVLQNQNPAPFDTGVLPGVDVVLELIDVDLGLNESTVVLKVGGVEAYKNSSQQAGYVVTKLAITDGFRYTINPATDLTEGSTHIVEVYVEDAAAIPNVLDTSYQFVTADVTGPFLKNLVPADGALGVSVLAATVLEIVTEGLPVNESTVVIQINGVDAYKNSVQQAGFSVVRSPVFSSTGFKYIIDPTDDFTSAIYVTVTIYAEDSNVPPNVLSTSYQFQIEDLGALNDLTGVKVHAPSLITHLAKDFAIELDNQESEARQRSWVRNVSKWIGLKGTEKAYKILGAISGFDVDVSALFRISQGFDDGLPNANVFEIVESARFGTDGLIDVGIFFTLRFESPTAAFVASDVGSQLRVSNAVNLLFDKLYTIAMVINSTTVEFTDESYGGGIPPEFGIGSAGEPKLVWKYLKLYADQPPLLPSFDELVPDVMTEVVGTCPADDPCFSIDKFCWEEAFGSSGVVNISAVSLVAEGRYLIRAGATSGDPHILDAILGPTVDDLATWRCTDVNGTPFYVETVPVEVVAGPPREYEFETTTFPAPVVGAMTMQYICKPQLLCFYCAASKVRLVITAGTISSDTGLALVKAFERVLRRIRSEVIPAHVEIAVVFKQEFEAYLVQGGHDGSLVSGSTVFRSPSAELAAVDLNGWLDILDAGNPDNVQRYSIGTVNNPAEAVVVHIEELGGQIPVLPDPSNPQLQWQVPVRVEFEGNREQYQPLYAPLTAYFDEIPGDEVTLDTTLFATVTTP